MESAGGREGLATAAWGSARGVEREDKWVGGCGGGAQGKAGAGEARDREKSLAYRLTQAKLPWNWTLDSFPFDRQPGVDRAQIRSLAGLDFLRRNENLILIGEPGTGKTGIAIALLRLACLNGHAGRFYNAQELLDELYASLADRSTPKLLAQLSRLQPLLID